MGGEMFLFVMLFRIDRITPEYIEPRYPAVAEDFLQSRKASRYGGLHNTDVSPMDHLYAWPRRWTMLGL